MDSKKVIKCSLCSETTHNKRTCPHKPIDDTFIRNDGEYIEESVTITPNKDILIKDLLDKQSYDIGSDIFEIWLHNNRPCLLKEIKYTMDRGLSNDSIMLYLRIIADIDTYY